MNDPLSPSLEAARRCVRTFLASALAASEGALATCRRRVVDLLPESESLATLEQLDHFEVQISQNYREAVAAADSLLVTISSLGK
jgi:hypothetical protein